ncbi:MAG: ABC transporter ATP-binding protein [Peptostreptococcaceae bacterium]
MENIITYQNIKKEYSENIIVDNFNLSIEKGEFVSIIGSSGCGKTTILKMINGLVTPNSGDLLVFGENIKDVNMIEHRRKIGYSIQGSVLFPHMNVYDNILYVPNLSKKSKDLDSLVDTWLDIVKIDRSLKHRYPNELSGGQQQRVGIARALISSPKILLMDEPFGAVDEITREQLQDELKEIHRKNDITILFVTHDIKEALKLGTKVLVMNKGEIHQYDSPENIINNPKTEFVKKLVKKAV